MNDSLHETRIRELENGHNILSRDYTRLNDAIVKISDSLSAFVVLQEQNKTIIHSIEKQSKSIEDVDNRLNNVELSMPQLIETRNWVLVLLGIIVSAVFVSIVALVIK